jgi:hypothetical protein
MAIAHQLCQNTPGCLRVDERDLEPEQPFAWTRVDQLDPIRLQTSELAGQVADRERDVVHAGATFGHEPADGCVRPQCEQELDAAVADAERCGLDALGGNDGAVLDGGPEQERVRLDRSVEVLDRDADVMDP